MTKCPDLSHFERQIIYQDNVTLLGLHWKRCPLEDKTTPEPECDDSRLAEGRCSLTKEASEIILESCLLCFYLPFTQINKLMSQQIHAYTSTYIHM